MSRKKLTEIHLVSYQDGTNTGIKLEVEAYVSKYAAKNRRNTLLGTIGSTSTIKEVNSLLTVKVLG